MPLGWTASRSVIVPLGAVRPGGGTVARTCLVVQRLFPPLYRDRLSDGRYLRRTPRAKSAADRHLEGGMQQVRYLLLFRTLPAKRGKGRMQPSNK